MSAKIIQMIGSCLPKINHTENQKNIQEKKCDSIVNEKTIHYTVDQTIRCAQFLVFNHEAFMYYCLNIVIPSTSTYNKGLVLCLLRIYIEILSILFISLKQK